MKKLLSLFILLVSLSLFSQDSKEISGFITSLKSPLAGVNIIVENGTNGTKTNTKGYYSISVKKGEIITFSYVGMKTIQVVVEDVTKVLNIEMTFADTMLDEVTIKGKNSLDFGTKSKINTFSTRRGTINTKKIGYGISFINGKNLNLAATSLGRALQGKLAGYRLATDAYGNEYAYLRSGFSLNLPTYAIWDVDGVIYQSPPPLNLNDIEDVGVIRSLAGTNSYGTAGKGGVIVVRTKNATYTKDIYSKLNPYTNKEYYNKDALSYKKIKFNQPEHLTFFDTITNSNSAYNYYLKIRSSFENRPNFHFDIADYFLKSHNDLIKYQAILLDLEEYTSNNAENLKAIAYKYQKHELHQKALEVYKKVFRLRPNYAQSFRDLANTYMHLKEYQNAWKIYKYYLQKGYKLEENAIGTIMYREMEALYMLKKEEANIKDIFERKENSSSTISSDIRLVFEWNTSEAEFALEFVNPQQQSYLIEHSLAESNDLILDEKIKGYSSKEFIIEKMKDGNWLVNINYLGNKKYIPTYLKLTVYYNWARPNQTEQIKVFKLTAKDLKINLLNLNASYSFDNNN